MTRKEPTLSARSNPDFERSPAMSIGEGIIQPSGHAFFKSNKAVRVSFAGGLIGLFLGSHRGKVDKVLKTENAGGWSLAEVIPDNPNLIIWIVRLILLIATLGLWTISTGYIFVFARPN